MDLLDLAIVMGLGTVSEAAATVAAGTADTLEIQTKRSDGITLLVDLQFDGATIDADTVVITGRMRDGVTYTVHALEMAIAERGDPAAPIRVTYASTGTNDVVLRATVLTLAAAELAELLCAIGGAA